MRDINAANVASEPALYENIHRIHTLDRATEEDLCLIIKTFPVIDNHAHNLLREEHAYGSQEYPFESITSEAQGHALQDYTGASLPHIRGVRQLADLFKCQPTFNHVKSARNEWVRRDYASLIKKCLEGTHAIMMDDGLAPEVVNPVGWHQQFVPTVSRIVRIESLAAELLEQLVYTAGLIKPERNTNWNKDHSEALLVRFNTMFRNSIRTLAQNPLVRGFKSIICYRSGLDISLKSRNVFRPHQSLTASTLLSSFDDFLRQTVQTHRYHIQRKEVNDYLVVAVCDVLDKLIDTDGESLPIQFHTGLGDSDIDLVNASPAHLKPIITAFPHVDFVLLHASYPYTREAGYMASIYANVWLDIGLIFPMLSRGGQESALRQAIELSPTSKLLWSTDGHLHPETYYLANRQFRAALEKILVECTRAGDISVSQAIDTAVDVLFWNSNHLYKLDEERKYPELLNACGRLSRGGSQPLANSVHVSNSFSSTTTTAVVLEAPAAQNSSSLASRKVSSPRQEDIMIATLDQDIAAFDAFLKQNPSVKYIWITHVDYVGTTRLRMLPKAAFRRHLTSGKYPAIPSAVSDITPNDSLVPGVSASGELRTVPDVSAISLNTVIQSSSASVPAWWMEDADNAPDHLYTCPRWALQSKVEALQAEFGLTILMGFEIEVVFMRPIYNSDQSDFADFQPVNLIHAWSSMTYQDLDLLPMIEEIVEALAAAGIAIDHFHTELAPGQWEFPLPPFEPLKAIDILYKARDIIRWIAKKHGLKATLYPRPYDFAPGSASHAHFSINGAKGAVEKYADPFLAGVLKHLAAILAFSLPTEESYARVGAHLLAGGEWISWGSQNRETPIRKCGPGHWELKSIDGMGNKYLSMAALLSSGLDGLRDNLKLTHKDNLGDASEMSAEQRKELGITTMLPKTLTESLASLEEDQALKSIMGEKLVNGYVNLKRHEMKVFSVMDEKERKRWLMGRY